LPAPLPRLLSSREQAEQAVGPAGPGDGDLVGEGGLDRGEEAGAGPPQSDGYDREGHGGSGQEPGVGGYLHVAVVVVVDELRREEVLKVKSQWQDGFFVGEGIFFHICTATIVVGR
jgi:hypothetical protein